MTQPHSLNLMAAINDVNAAHAAIGENIATHAERHASHLEQLRSKLESDHAIKSGIDRHTQAKQSAS